MVVLVCSHLRLWQLNIYVSGLLYLVRDDRHVVLYSHPVVPE